MKTYKIYKITNKINQMSYIGFTSATIKHRWTKHKEESAKPIFHTRKLYCAISEYGIKNFSIEEIFSSKDVIYILTEMENYFINEYDTLNNGYNMRPGGGGYNCHSAQKISVDLYDSNNNLIKTFQSMLDAALFLDVPQARISGACKNASNGKGSKIKSFWVCYHNENPVYKKANSMPGCEAAKIINTGKKRPEHSAFIKKLSKEKDAKNTFIFIHKSGLKFTGSRMQLISKYPEHNIANSELGCMIRGTYKTHRGWSLLPDDVPV